MVGHSLTDSTFKEPISLGGDGFFSFSITISTMTSEITPFEPDLESDDGQAYPWAPQPGETSLGFYYFGVYRDLGPRRTVAAAARQLGVVPETLRALSSRYSWVDRSLAFDAWLDARAVEELARGRTKMRQEHADIAVLAREKILKRLRTMDPNEMGARDLATWMDLSVKIERQARGEADKKIEISGEVNVIEQLDSDARRGLMADALAVLNERLGIGQLEAYVEAEIVEEEDETDGGPE